MKKLTIFTFLAVFLNSSLYSQVYYEAIGEAAKQRNNYDVTTTDLYGNYAKFQIQIENLNPSTKVYSGFDLSQSDNRVNFDFGKLALDAARSARQQKQRNADNQYLSRIRYLEFELRAALNIIKNQSDLMGTSNMLSENMTNVLKDEIKDLRILLGFDPNVLFMDKSQRPKATPRKTEIKKEVELVEEELAEEVPFAIIDKAPIFPGCEDLENKDLKNCFQDKINEHIRNNFIYPKIAQEMGIQGRVYVEMIIDSDGLIKDIRTRGPDRNLEEAAKELIKKLPRMIPGKSNGVPVRVPFSIPITYRLQ